MCYGFALMCNKSCSSKWSSLILVQFDTKTCYCAKQMLTCGICRKCSVQFQKNVLQQCTGMKVTKGCTGVVLPVHVDRMLSTVALDVSCNINVKKSSSTSENGASSDEFAESLVAAARDCCCHSYSSPDLFFYSSFYSIPVSIFFYSISIPVIFFYSISVPVLCEETYKHDTFQSLHCHCVTAGSVIIYQNTASKKVASN